MSEVATALARRLACSPKAAANRLARARSLLPELIAAADETGRSDWLRWWFLEADSLRAGPRLDFDNWLLNQVAKKDTREDDALTAMLTNPRCAEAHRAWLKALEDEIAAKTDLLAAARGTQWEVPC